MRIFILGIFSSFVFSACHPENCPDELLYELPFTLLNPSDTISVGDTLLYESIFDKVLYDKNGNLKNIFEDYDFTFIFCYLTKIDSTAEQGGRFLIDTVNFVGSLGHISFSDGYDFYPLNYFYDSNNGYNLKIGIIIKEPGLFTIQIGYLDTKRKTQTNCTTHYVAWAFNQSVEDTNFDMLQSSPLPFWQTYKRSDWDRLASYCVYVKP